MSLNALQPPSQSHNFGTQLELCAMPTRKRPLYAQQMWGLPRGIPLRIMPDARSGLASLPVRPSHSTIWRITRYCDFCWLQAIGLLVA